MERAVVMAETKQDKLLLSMADTEARLTAIAESLAREHEHHLPTNPWAFGAWLVSKYGVQSLIIVALFGALFLVFDRFMVPLHESQIRALDKVTAAAESHVGVSGKILEAQIVTQQKVTELLDETKKQGMVLNSQTPLFEDIKRTVEDTNKVMKESK
jgi:hypothetical protein